MRKREQIKENIKKDSLTRNGQEGMCVYICILYQVTVQVKS